MPQSDFLEDRALLQSIFPRGRFTKDEDGSCILTSRRKSRRGHKLYRVLPHERIGLYYTGPYQAYLASLKHLVIAHQKCTDEGILYLRWSPKLRKLLPDFQKRQPNDPAAHRLLRRPAQEARFSVKFQR